MNPHPEVSLKPYCIDSFVRHRWPSNPPATVSQILRTPFPRHEWSVWSRSYLSLDGVVFSRRETGQGHHHEAGSLRWESTSATSEGSMRRGLHRHSVDLCSASAKDSEHLSLKRRRRCVEPVARESAPPYRLSKRRRGYALILTWSELSRLLSACRCTMGFRDIVVPKT